MTPLAQLLGWAAPPLVGGALGAASIGIAFRMIFRPLEEVRVLGVRVPGTPGLLPRKHRELAASIGRLVARELVNEQTLRAQVHGDRAATALAESVASATEALLASPVSTLAPGAPAASSTVLPQLLRGLLQKLLGSPSFLHGVRDAVTRLAGSLSTRRLQELLERFDPASIVKDRLLPRLADPANRSAIAGSLARALGDSPTSLLSDELLGSLSEAAQPYLPFAAERLVGWMRSDQTRAYLSAQGRDLLPRILEKLNILQRFLLNAGQFDRRLDEKMPEIVDETLRTLERIVRDDQQQLALLTTLIQAARDWRDRPASASDAHSSGARNGGAQELSGSSVQRVIEQILKSLEDEQTRDRISRLLQDRLSASNPTVGSLLRDLTGRRDSDIADQVVDRVLGYLSRVATSEGDASGLGDLAARILRENAGAPLGELLGIDAERKRRIDRFLQEKLLATIDARLPELLRRLDIESLVTGKLRALDLRAVEELASHSARVPLRWIGAGFGVLLGLAVDLVQHLVFLLG